MRIAILIFSVAVAFPRLAVAACSNPCGAEEVLSCAAADYQAGMTGKKFWDTVLFDADTVGVPVLDGFCSQTFTEKQFEALNWSPMQKIFFTEFCKVKPGAYYSYENFVAAAKSFPTFLCGDGATYAQKRQELALMLATFAQETTGNGIKASVDKYTRDGLYFRYENGMLDNAQDLNYRTGYYDKLVSGAIYVAVKEGTSPMLTSTPTYWWNKGRKYDDSVDVGNVIDLASAKTMSVKWGDVVVPAGYALKGLWEMVEPAYVVGIGSVQLTGDTMMSFFGFYYNHLAPGKPVAAADFGAFVKRLFTDGELAFTGAIWYFMYRTNGDGYRPIDAMLNDADMPVCGDMAAVTMQVNGGCNDTEKRYEYYKYLRGKLKRSPAEVSFQGPGMIWFKGTWGWEKRTGAIEVSSVECKAFEVKGFTSDATPPAWVGNYRYYPLKELCVFPSTKKCWEKTASGDTCPP